MKIKLLNNKNCVVGETVVDEEDYVSLSNWVWRLHPDGYAVRYTRINGKFSAVLMHRKILGLYENDQRQGDHVNRNRLDNRRSNLRIITSNGNRQNRSSHRTAGKHKRTSSFRGVGWSKSRSKWRARVRIEGKLYELGYFDIEEEAAQAAENFRKENMAYA